MTKALDLTGKRFGKLVALSRAENPGRRGTFWNCVCDCGKTTVVATDSLTSGKTRSCGCGRLEGVRKTAEKIRGRISPRRIDLTGRTFGRLTVLGFSRRNDKGINLWRCRCECGNDVEVRGDALRNGKTRSCGCLAREVHSHSGKLSTGRVSSRRMGLAGKIFGRLTVLEPVPRFKKPLRWRCRCVCGKETLVLASKLVSGRTQSCGCLGLEHATQAKIKHGGTHSRLYNVWSAMRRRCENPNVDAFKYYGGKGVKVCAEWHDYGVFMAWANAHGYADGLTIDRMDSNGDYCPENCRWLTSAENISRAKRYPDEIRAKALALLEQGNSCAEAARQTGVSKITIYNWRKAAKG